MADMKVLITRRLNSAGPDLLRAAGVEIDEFEEDRAMTREELLTRVADKDGLLTTAGNRVNDELLDAAPRLKGVANYAVGYDNIDLEAMRRRGIPATNTPDVLTDATADQAWALMLAAARRIAEGDRFVRDGKWIGWSPWLMLGTDVAGAALGIVGAGRIGQAMARRATGFNMRILYWSRETKLEFEAETGARRVELDELLAESDFVSLHVALTPDTRGMIGEAQLNRMKPTAILVNAARGSVVDEEALVRALREKRIAAAGLDVYEKEPQVHPGLIELTNVVLAPHLGSATVQTRKRMSILAAENLLAMLRGEEPPNRVV